MRQSVVEEEGLPLPDGKDEEDGRSERRERGGYLLDLEAWEPPLSRLKLGLLFIAIISRISVIISCCFSESAKA